MKKIVIAIVLVMGLMASGCSKMDTGNNGLKNSVENGVTSISNAVNKISGTAGYQLLTMNDASAKSDYTYNDSINLNAVSGVYDFQPDTIMRMHHFSPYKMFKKTAESDNMIISLPEAIVLHPKHLHYYQPMDTVYPNNFTITASDYHFYYNMWRNYEYKLTAGLTLNDENAGNMDVSSSSRSFRSYAYASGFDFPDGYNISAMWQYGDTAASSFSLSKDNDTLFKESSIFITQDFHRREKQYELTIGDVQIKKSDVDSIQVFVAGVLQQHAAKIITSESDTAASVCHKRDILLTYDDGTTAKLSELISPVKSQLGLLSDSLRSMYFARHIVDYIAFSIYYDTHQYYY